MKSKTKGAKAVRPKVEVDVAKLDELVDSAELRPLQKDECSELKAAIHQLATELARQQAQKKGYRSTETAKKLIAEYGSSLDLAEKHKDGDDQPKEEKPKGFGGNGRRAVADYVGATTEKICLPEEFKPKQSCDGCGRGKYYRLESSPILRITGLPPIQAKVFLLEKTRCNLCGDIHTAAAPEDVGEDKYDASVAAMLGILKYGMGMPFKRIETLQKQLGVPLSASTQFELVDDAAAQLGPVHLELVRQAAQGQVVTFDDTRAQILDEVERPADQDEDRVGIKTTGLVVELDDKKAAIFITGPQHGGENMSEFLKHRARGLEPIVSMADASSQNNPKVPLGVDLLQSACITHGRRQFVNVFENFVTFR